MRDYAMQDENGRWIPVSEMSLVDIIECLVEGVEILSNDTAEAVRERLELEIFIRKKGLRTCTN